MNPIEAKTFDRQSEKQVVILALAAQDNGCQCEAYVDWYTYRRWQAQGFQVQRGEKGVHLQNFVPYVETDPKTGKEHKKTRPWKSVVFCRCQVKGVK